MSIGNAETKLTGNKQRTINWFLTAYKCCFTVSLPQCMLQK